MPSGYTAAVADGSITTLREFALQCARGMGACIMMRDEPWDAPIPERFEPSTKYHDDALALARADLKELAELSSEECEARAAAQHAEALTRHVQREVERTEQRNRYSAMLARVVQWETGAEGIKNFMVEQLQTGRSFDCDGRWDKAPEQLSGDQWREAALKRARHDVEYHSGERAKEIERTEARNAWLKALRESLPGEAVPA